MDFLKPVLLDLVLPDGSIVDLYAWEESAGTLIVAAMVRLNEAKARKRARPGEVGNYAD